MQTLKYIKYLVFGARFNHSFSLLDNWGEIADDILYKTKYFGYEFFTNISSQYTLERSLYNPNTNNVLNLSPNNLVFKYYILKDKDFEEEFSLFKERINKYLVENILTKYKLVINRIGIVYASELGENELNKFKKKYFKNNITNITDFRFAQKEPTSSAKLWHDVNDYINKIYTVGKMHDVEDYVGITYDFQLYFNPLQQDIRKICSVFLNKSFEAYEKDILSLGIQNE